MTSANASNDNDSPIYYFGYGPMVHPAVRERRGIQVTGEQPAVLRDHRLTFAFGGVASVVPQRGYDIHGIVMRCQSQNDWDKLREQETGFYAAELDVLPYQNSSSCAFASEACPLSPEVDDYDSDDSNDSDNRIMQAPPIRAFVFVMNEFDKDKLDRPIEKLPQERYLRLIATGMQKYNSDEAYIDSEILGVPFSPSRKPHEYLQFPPWKGHQTSAETLPRISFARYQDFCRQAEDNTDDVSTITAESTSHSSHYEQQQDQPEEQPKHVPLCFIVGKHVIWVPQHDPKHAGAMWLRKHGSGKRDASFTLHTFVIDPDIPYCETPAQVTPLVQSWAENQMVISVASGLDAYRVLEVVDIVQDESPGIEQILEALLQRTFDGSISQDEVGALPSTTLSCDGGHSPKRGRAWFRRGSTGILQNALRRIGASNRTESSTGNNRLRASTNTNNIPVGKVNSTGPLASPPPPHGGMPKRWPLQMRRSHS